MHALKECFVGTVLAPGDDGFDSVSPALSPAGRPSFVARAATPSDVVEAIRIAREESVPISVRSGGHSRGQWTTTPGGFLLDLSGMNTIEVLGDRLVRLGTGAVWGDVARALKNHGLALTSGDTTSVGVGGLTLGGGIGWMVRKYGLALDNLVKAEVVTAAGEIVTASPLEQPELFWALRGGGGNFGVVTHFTFRAHPLSTVHAGPIRYDVEDLAPLLRGWRDVMRGAPEELNATFLAMPSFGPEMPASTQILVCYADSDEAAAEAAVEPLRGLLGARDADIREKDYVDVLEDPQPPEAPLTIVANNGFAPDFSDDAIDAIARVQRELGGVLMIRSLRGAFNLVSADETAFGFRDSEMLVISAAFLPPDAPPAATDRVRALWAEVSPFLAGSYGNFLSGSDEQAIAAMFPLATRSRLAAIKHRYDPQNLFSQNQNIAPVST
jgi:FAD/FMN-containing dehydrogenase